MLWEWVITFSFYGFQWRISASLMLNQKMNPFKHNNDTNKIQWTLAIYSFDFSFQQWSPLSCCLRFSMMPGVSTKVTVSSSLWGISIPTSRSRKPWPNFSRGEKDRELSAAITMPSMVRDFSPCIMTVYSEVVGSAPDGRDEEGMI